MLKKKYFIVFLLIKVSLVFSSNLSSGTNILRGINNIPSRITSLIPEGTIMYIGSGLSWLSYGDDYSKYSNYSSSSSKLGYAIGFTLPIEFLDIDIAYNRRNNSTEFIDRADLNTVQLDTTIISNLNLDYINFGIKFPYTPPIPVVYESLSIYAGLDFGYFLNGSLTKTTQVKGYENQISQSSIDAERDYINQLDYGLVFGARYNVLNTFYIHLNYYHGLKDFWNRESQALNLNDKDLSTKHKYFLLSLGYQF